MAIMTIPEAMRSQVLWQYQHPSYTTTWKDMTAPMSLHLEHLYLLHLQDRRDLIQITLPDGMSLWLQNGDNHLAQVTLPDTTSLYFDFENMMQISENNNVTRNVRRMMRMEEA